MRVSCGSGGHVREMGTNAAKVSTRWSQAGSQKRLTLRAPHPPACALVALGHTDSRAQIGTPPPPPVPRKLSTPWPRASPAQKWGSWHGVPPVPVHGSVILPHLPKMSRRLGRIVKEAASTVAKKAALAQPREPPGRPRTGSGGEGTPHFSSQDGWGPRELAARLRARRIPLGTAGFLG